MKRILSILILNAVILCSCGKKSPVTSTNETANVVCNLPESDSSILSDNRPTAFIDNIEYIDNVENKDSVCAVIEDSIIQHALRKDIIIPQNCVDRYKIIDSLLHVIYNSGTPPITTMEINDDLAITVNQIRFLNYYLLRELKGVVNNQVLQLLYQEQSLADSLVSAQKSYLKTHFDNAYRVGSCDFVKYFNVKIAIIKDLNKSLQDLLFAFASPEINIQNPNRELPQSVFDNEFRHILNDLIPPTLWDEELLACYDKEADRQSVKSMENAWKAFLSKRNEIASLLPDIQKRKWDNATYRFQRTQIISLKNEFEGGGVISNEVLECLLSDSCTYDELLAYPNFSTKWNEHLKEFE